MFLPKATCLEHIHKQLENTIISKANLEIINQCVEEEGQCMEKQHITYFSNATNMDLAENEMKEEI